MQAGFDHARGRVIVSMDGDLQNDPRDIPELLKKVGEGYDLVCGWRKNRKDKLLVRKVPSRVANWLIGRLTGIRIHDTGCSLKAFKRSTIEKTRLYSDMHRFIPAMLSLTGVRYVEIPVRHHPRVLGRSKYGLSRIWKVFLDLFSVKMLIGFSSRPTLWFGLLSAPFFLLAAVFTALSGRAYLSPQPAGGFSIVSPTAAFLFFALATHLFLLGLLGELVRRFSPVGQVDMLDMTNFEEWEGSAAGAGGNGTGGKPDERTVEK